MNINLDIFESEPSHSHTTLCNGTDGIAATVFWRQIHTSVLINSCLFGFNVNVTYNATQKKKVQQSKYFFESLLHFIVFFFTQNRRSMNISYRNVSHKMDLKEQFDRFSKTTFPQLVLKDILTGSFRRCVWTVVPPAARYITERCRAVTHKLTWMQEGKD